MARATWALDASVWTVPDDRQFRGVEFALCNYLVAATTRGLKRVTVVPVVTVVTVVVDGVAVVAGVVVIVVVAVVASLEQPAPTIISRATAVAEVRMFRMAPPGRACAVLPRVGWSTVRGIANLRRDR